MNIFKRLSLITLLACFTCSSVLAMKPADATEQTTEQPAPANSFLSSFLPWNWSRKRTRDQVKEQAPQPASQETTQDMPKEPAHKKAKTNPREAALSEPMPRGVAGSFLMSLLSPKSSQKQENDPIIALQRLYAVKAKIEQTIQKYEQDIDSLKITQQMTHPQKLQIAQRRQVKKKEKSKKESVLANIESQIKIIESKIQQTATTHSLALQKQQDEIMEHMQSDPIVQQNNTTIDEEFETLQAEVNAEQVAKITSTELSTQDEMELADLQKLIDAEDAQKPTDKKTE